MGHYELKVTDDGCPIYAWTPTITPKKRLPDARAFVDLYPSLSEDLERFDPVAQRATQTEEEHETGDEKRSDEAGSSSVAGVLGRVP